MQIIIECDQQIDTYINRILCFLIFCFFLDLGISYLFGKKKNEKKKEKTKEKNKIIREKTLKKFVFGVVFFLTKHKITIQKHYKFSATKFPMNNLHKPFSMGGNNIVFVFMCELCLHVGGGWIV